MKPFWRDGYHSLKGRERITKGVKERKPGERLRRESNDPTFNFKISKQISSKYMYTVCINPLAPEFSFKFEHTLYLKCE
jgi:hypothetical protein